MSSAFDLARIRDEMAAAPLVSPWPFEVAVAVVNDVFRMGGELQPPAAITWLEWATRKGLVEEQAGMLAHALASTSLREASVAALATRKRDLSGAPTPAAQKMLAGFLEAIAPLTAEMIRSNAFRQEEFLRRWVEAISGTVAGEKADASRRRLEQLDYRKTLAEYDRAEGARKLEADKRARLRKEAEEREAAARGWRE
jgi:hypothetical protein